MTLLEEFRKNAYRTDQTLHADLTLLAYLSLLPSEARLRITSEPGQGALSFVHSGPGSHGSFSISQASAPLKVAVRDWLALRETARALAGVAPPDETL